MHVCMYACMHVCMYACVHAYIHVCIHAIIMYRYITLLRYVELVTGVANSNTCDNSNLQKTLHRTRYQNNNLCRRHEKWWTKSRHVCVICLSTAIYNQWSHGNRRWNVITMSNQPQFIQQLSRKPIAQRLPGSTKEGDNSIR